ncbi:hypothetical protein WJX72_009705 [[Myrmecia] bisecta]|uniref:AAA+ ATPase domain-containing protein n=1 Tax=[Myrmecia] bisecta TaxID=41462 RepID=A0AAW1Q822_9CHLO
MFVRQSLARWSCTNPVLITRPGPWSGSKRAARSQSAAPAECSTSGSEGTSQPCAGCRLLQSKGGARPHGLRRPGWGMDMLSCSQLQHRSHKRVRLRARAAAKEQQVAPPKPAPRFSRQDLKRIKEQGPTVADLVHIHRMEWQDRDKTLHAEERAWIPPQVLGSTSYMPEPKWHALPQMSFMEFYQGLRERNWTSEHYKATSEPWKISFFRDSGRLMRPSWEGFRAFVTRPDGSVFWVNMPSAGAETYIYDHLAGGTGGGIWKGKKVPQQPVALYQYGYNQVFEQVFQAYEQQLSEQGAKEWQNKMWVSTTPQTYRCPGEQLMGVSFQMTPNERTFHGVWDRVPSFLFFTFSFSFLAVCLAIGIFKPRKQMPNDPIQAMEFAQSKGQARKEGRTNVKFADVAGLDATVSDLRDVVEFLKNPKRYKALSAKPPKGVLLEGDPGTGKTLIAKAIAGEAGVPFYQMSGSEFVEAIVGVGAARVRDLFKRARAQKEPCIIFVDEIDALGTRRAEAGMQTNEEREQTLNQLLSEMDGFTPDIGVVFVAATNRADLLDAALTRPGRFDRKIRILRPDTQGRYEILKVHARNRPLAEDVDLMQLARDLPGLSGAELANILNESALEVVRRDGDQITAADIYNAIDRVLQGVRRPPLPDRLPVKRAFAVHEVGKGLVATVLRQQSGRLEAVERVSMVPRGRDWTRTIFLRGEDEQYTMTTRARLLERLRVVVAGRAAEEVVLGDATTYSISDLRDGARLAQKIVANYGLSDEGITIYAPPTATLGFMRKSFEVSVDNIDADLFGKGIKGGMWQPSDESLHRLRTAMYGLLGAAYEEVTAILEAHREALDAATDAILEKESLTGAELEEFIRLHPPRELPRGHAGGNGTGANGNGASAADEYKLAGASSSERQ